MKGVCPQKRTGISYLFQDKLQRPLIKKIQTLKTKKSKRRELYQERLGGKELVVGSSREKNKRRELYQEGEKGTSSWVK